MYLALPLVLLFFNDTATTEIYTLPLHDALPISTTWPWTIYGRSPSRRCAIASCSTSRRTPTRSEEHTSELPSRPHLVCRLLPVNRLSSWSPSPFTSDAQQMLVQAVHASYY